MTKKKLLFIDSCVRGEGVSRTLALCEGFLAELNGRYDIERLELEKLGISPMGNKVLKQRDALLAEDKRKDSFFDYANSFAAADRLVIGAPYWDWSFPSCLKAYIEKVSVEGITFEYVGSDCIGLCKAEKALYICTAGGYIDGEHLGTEYVKHVFKQYGINDFTAETAEGIDIWGNDSHKILAESAKRLAAIAVDF